MSKITSTFEAEEWFIEDLDTLASEFGTTRSRLIITALVLHAKIMRTFAEGNEYAFVDKKNRVGSAIVLPKSLKNCNPELN